MVTTVKSARAVVRIALAVFVTSLLACGYHAGGEELPRLNTLIIAPHSDDEAIGCTALMLRALARRERIGIVVVTPGDGFPKAAAAAAQKPIADLKPSDFEALAALRQRHTLQAMKELGIATDDIYFLGYPDGGLATMYEADVATPFQQPFTKRSETYGIVQPDYHTQKHKRAAPYLKSSVTADLAEIIRDRRPTVIFTTHEVDTHADHRTTFRFVRDAARAANSSSAFYAYVVHGAPPPTKPSLELTLTAEELRRKRALLELYQAGVSPVHDGLADEYTRSEELFWQIDLKTEPKK